MTSKWWPAPENLTAVGFAAVEGPDGREAIEVTLAGAVCDTFRIMPAAPLTAEQKAQAIEAGVVADTLTRALTREDVIGRCILPAAKRGCLAVSESDLDLAIVRELMTRTHLWISTITPDGLDSVQRADSLFERLLPLVSTPDTSENRVEHELTSEMGADGQLVSIKVRGPLITKGLRLDTKYGNDKVDDGVFSVMELMKLFGFLTTPKIKVVWTDNAATRELDRIATQAGFPLEALEEENLVFEVS